MYRWNRGTICVHDVIMGSFWAEVYGKVDIVNKKTGEREGQEVYGKVSNVNKKTGGRAVQEVGTCDHV